MTSSDSFLIIAVDGGAASGKSSTCRALSAHFGFLHVDTGSYYRAITDRLLRAGVKADDEEGVARALAETRLETRVEKNTAVMVINGSVPGEEIRSPGVNEAVSSFAALPAVRSFLFAYQRDQVKTARREEFRGLIMEGRDIGSVIFPEADFRFFLQADPEARARRRAEQGQTDRIAERDKLDTERKTSPLVCPPGATLIDSTHLTLDEVVAEMIGMIERGV